MSEQPQQFISIKDIKQDVMQQAIDPRDKFTLSIAAMFEHPGDAPDQFALTKQSYSESGEQLFKRRLTIEEVRTLDIGWIAPEQVGMLAIQNLEGIGLQVNQSEEEKCNLAERVLYVYPPDGINAMFKISPGNALICEAVEPHLLRVGPKCLDKSVRIRYYLFPK